MFERFTDRARRVMVLAQEEARMLNHNHIGTEHLLLGLIHEGEGVAAQALESLGVSLPAVRQQVEEIIGRGQQALAGRIPFTPRAKKVLELSRREALAMGHNYVGTEHILLGLLREGDGVAAQVLVRMGADLAAAVPFYGAQPPAGDVAKIKAPLLIHYAGLDTRINGGWPAYEEALKANHVTYTAYIYEGANHGFHNDTTPRYDEAAAKLAWQRTLEFFNKYLRG